MLQQTATLCTRATHLVYVYLWFSNLEVWKFHFDANERLLLVIKQDATDDLIQRKPTIYTHQSWVNSTQSLS